MLLRWGLLVVLLLILVGFGAAMMPGDGADNALAMPTVQAHRGPLTISVVESGTVRPREQLILKNGLDDPATIISIVKEGALVKKGDLIVELDVSARRKELVERRIRVQSAQASVVFADENFKIAQSQGQADIDQAELTLRFAISDLDQYLKGQYPRLLKEADAKITLAQEDLARAQELYNGSGSLFARGFVTMTAMKQDQLAVKRAQLAVDLAKADMDLLQQHTHARQLATFESAVKQSEMAVERMRRRVTASMAQAEADVKAKKALLEAEKSELEELEEQVAKAKITAPIDGMVLYASSVSEDWDEDEPKIDIGAVVDERGEIIYLPTTGAYNVDVKILEVNLRKVRVGQPVRILLDAMPSRVFTGKVVNISPVPDSDSTFLNPNLKLYNSEIEIEGIDPALRNGLSCRAEIFVEEHPDAVQVPIQCVTRINGAPTIHFIEGGQVTPRPVEIGMDNGRFVHVLSGLQANQKVLLAPPLTHSEAPRSNEPAKSGS